MQALPEHPTERDRERFKAAVTPIMTWCFFDRDPATGEYTDHETANLFRLWWSVERERQLLQNLNQSQGRKLSEMGARLAKAESELEAERKRLDWALSHDAMYYKWDGVWWFHWTSSDDVTDMIETDNPRATIDELIAGEKK